MSLGSSYGQPFDDDLSVAVDNATNLGILTVASAGNSADKPLRTHAGCRELGTVVAQTAMPSGFLPLMQILAPANIVAVSRPCSSRGRRP